MEVICRRQLGGILAKRIKGSAEVDSDWGLNKVYSGAHDAETGLVLN